MDCSFFQSAMLDYFSLAQTSAGAVSSGISGSQYLAVFVVLLILVVPFVVGGLLAKSLKMPNASTRLGWLLLALVASAAVLFTAWPKLGVDLRGGTILVYEIDAEKLRDIDEEGGQRITSDDLIGPLTWRINPSGTQEIILRPYGESQVEIIVPEVDQSEVDRIKNLVAEAGILRFAILANLSDHATQYSLAVEQARPENSLGLRTSPNVKNAAGQIVAFWANIDREADADGNRSGPLRVDVSTAIVRNPDTGEILELPALSEAAMAEYIDEQGMSGLETLMILSPEEELNVKGSDLAFAASTFDQNGAPAVAFTLTDRGSGKFYALTSDNSPDGTRQRRLGIVLDDNLLSAPNILQPIRKEGRITGRFTRAEVQQLVAVLKAGQLPTALTKEPIAENQIGATLGADTIESGYRAIGVSLLLVLLFILVYYRFAGIIACIALAMNLAMILATMVLINQPLTLPGLAGLVLTVGMSVDANVLIFERIREELKKGAAARMAIRNGFGKATVTIIDANLTTLITAIVLYAIGTDQIRGFAVTLILGILFSMFTAIYVSRTLFDIAERHGFLSLGMSDGVNAVKSMIAGESGLDFISKGKFTVVMSGVLVVVGLGALVSRGKGILDIDFAGGASVQFRLSESQQASDVRKTIATQMTNKDTGEEVVFTVNGVSMQGVPDGTVYKVDVSSALGNEKEDALAALKTAITEAYKESNVKLVTYHLDQSPAGDARRRSVLDSNGVLLTAARPQEDVAAESDEVETVVDVEAESPAANDQAAGADAEVDIAEVDIADAIAGPDARVSRILELSLEVQGDSEPATMGGISLKDALVSAAASLTGQDGNSIVLNPRVIELEPLSSYDKADAGYDAAKAEKEAKSIGEWNPESSLGFTKWKVELPLDAADADAVIGALKNNIEAEPVWISSSSVGARVAGDMIGRAFGALFASLLCIIGYIWFRFQRVMYGFAAVAALLHDVLITLGAIAVSAFVADALGFLLIDPFKISLTVVAAILTIIGYSLNDTIVVFDRIRETKGKAPRLTGEMINTSINQTLSRTLLTSLTTLIVVLLLYWFGGDGIHAFAFALVVGVIVGTYSSIFIASPILLWLIQWGEDAPSTE
jgi:SecD/SecF fusion protein